MADSFDCVAIADNLAVLDQSDVIFLGLTVGAAPKILAALRFQPDHKVISLMSGATLTDIASMIAPARAQTIMIPFLGITAGGSPVLVLGNAEVVRELFGDRNQIFEMASQDELAACLAAQAVLSPVVQMVSDAADWLGARAGEQNQAEAFLRVLVGSSLIASECTALLGALDTPGGYNQRLRQHMAASGMGAALAEGLDQLGNG